MTPTPATRALLRVSQGLLRDYPKWGDSWVWPARNVPSPRACHQCHSSEPPLAEPPRGHQVVLLPRDPEAPGPAPPRRAHAPPRAPASSKSVPRRPEKPQPRRRPTGAGVAGAGRRPGPERPPLLCLASGLRAFSEKRQVTRAEQSRGHPDLPGPLPGPLPAAPRGPPPLLGARDPVSADASDEDTFIGVTWVPHSAPQLDSDEAAAPTRRGAQRRAETKDSPGAGPAASLPELVTDPACGDLAVGGREPARGSWPNLKAGRPHLRSPGGAVEPREAQDLQPART